MRLTFISVGKDRHGPIGHAAEEYLERLTHAARVQVVELKASRQSGPAARHEEGQAILAAVKERDVLVALDQRGTALSSEAWARWLSVHRDGARDVSFAVGGDEGLDPTVTARASLVLSLSPMTLPHRLARLLLVEQVYRAFTIIRGEPYHK